MGNVDQGAFKRMREAERETPAPYVEHPKEAEEQPIKKPGRPKQE